MLTSILAVSLRVSVNVFEQNEGLYPHVSQVVLLTNIPHCCLCLRYVRIVGTHNTVNKVFHLVAFECMFTNRSFTLENGLLGKSHKQTQDRSKRCVRYICNLNCF